MKAVPQVLVLDTCVLISNVLRQAFSQLAADGCFRLAWSTVIGDEWRRNAARIWQVEDAEVHQLWDGLQSVFPEADQGDVSAYKAGLQRSDPKDWHVIAAGRAVLASGKADQVAVVTRNIKDFNRSELRKLGLDLFDPDQLLVACLRDYPGAMANLLAKLPTYTFAPDRDLEDLSVVLKRERLFRLNRLSLCRP